MSLSSEVSSCRTLITWQLTAPCLYPQSSSLPNKKTAFKGNGISSISIANKKEENFLVKVVEVGRKQRGLINPWRWRALSHVQPITCLSRPSRSWRDLPQSMQIISLLCTAMMLASLGNRPFIVVSSLLLLFLTLEYLVVMWSVFIITISFPTII